MSEWLITVKVRADRDTFGDGENVDENELLSAVRDEIVASLEECHAEAVIVDVKETEVDPTVAERNAQARTEAEAEGISLRAYTGPERRRVHETAGPLHGGWSERREKSSR